MRLRRNAQLTDSTVKASNASGYSYTTLQEFVGSISDVDRIFTPAEDIEVWIAKDAEWLLNHQNPSYNSAFVIRQLFAIFYDHGWVTSQNGIIRWDELISHIKTRLKVVITNGDERYENLFTRPRLSSVLSKKNSSLPPLFIITLSRILGFSIAELLNYKSRSKQPESEIMPCQNGTCINHSTNSVVNSEVLYSRAIKGYVGKFECPMCGCVFQKSLGTVGTKSIRMIDRGWSWRAELESLWADENLSQKDISKLLQVDIRTVQKAAIRYDLPGRKKRLSPKTYLLTALSQSSQLEVHQNKLREKFLKILSENPGISRTQINKLDGQTYSWLALNDKEWLSIHNVPIQKNNSQVRYKTYWGFKEQELIVQLPDVVVHLRSMPGQPKRITKTSIEREYIHISFTPEFLSHTPNFAALLRGAIETRVEFGLRMIDWAYQELMNSSKTITLSKIIHKAGVEVVRNDPAIQEKLATFL